MADAAEYDDPARQNPNYWEIFKAYEGGKSRRYGHLFAVNAGAYALVGFVSGRLGADQGLAAQLFGIWALLVVPVLLLAFCWVMCDDIHAFGRGMRVLAGWPADARLAEGIYRQEGRDLLRYVRLIFALGWGAAGAIGLALLGG